MSYITVILQIDGRSDKVKSDDEPEISLEDSGFVRISFSDCYAKHEGKSISLKGLKSTKTVLLRREALLSVETNRES